MNPNRNSGAVERRLKPIYDCLDNGSNRKAVQEADRLLKKIKDLNCAKALKSLALLRLSKDDAANEILSEIGIQQPLDNITLQTMAVCYRESLQFDKIVEIYDAACRHDPTNEELMAHLFMAYVRTGDFRKQTETARSLYKHHPKRPYYFWSIMSLIMEAREASALAPIDDVVSSCEILKKARGCLQLAETMCKKMINDNDKNHEEVEVEIYLSILHKLEKYDEEYRVLTGPLCQRNFDHLGQLSRRRAYLCLDLKMYSRALKHYFPSLIQEYPDQLEYYQQLFKCALKMDSDQALSDAPGPLPAAAGPGGGIKSSSLCDCFDLVEKQCLIALDCNSSGDSNNGLQSTQLMQANSGATGCCGGCGSGAGQQSNKPTQKIGKHHHQILSRSSSLQGQNQGQNKNRLRGPFIARVELYNLITTEARLGSSSENTLIQLANSHVTGKYASIKILLLDYFQLFSRKITCYYDMEYMMTKSCKLSRQEIAELLLEIQYYVATAQGASDMDQFYMRLNCLILEHSFCDYNSKDCEKRIKFMKKCLLEYDGNLSKFSSGAILPQTELLPIDHYCLLGINSVLTWAFQLLDPTKNLEKLTLKSVLSDEDLMILIVIINLAVNNSTANHQLKLILIKLYNFIGATKSSKEVVELLDIKHFQIDTLGHLLNPILYLSGHFKTSQSSLQTCLRFYSLSKRDCFESLTTSYRQCRFSKIEEISNVNDRLAMSLNYKQCAILSIILEIIESSNSVEMSTRTCLLYRSFNRHHADLPSAFVSFNLPGKRISPMIQWKKIRDNRDFKVLRSLHSHTVEHIQHVRNTTLHHDIMWLQLRYEMIRCASSCYAEIYSLPSSNSHGLKVQSQNVKNQTQADRSQGQSDKAQSSKNIDEDKNNDVLLESFTNLIQLQLEAAKERTQFRNQHDPQPGVGSNTFQKPGGAFSIYEPDLPPLLWNFINIDNHISIIKSLIEYYLNCYHHDPSQSSTNSERIDVNDEKKISAAVTEHKAKLTGYLDNILGQVELCVKQATTLPLLKFALFSLTQTIETLSLAIMILMAISPRLQQIHLPQIQAASALAASSSSSSSSVGGASGNKSGGAKNSSKNRSKTSANANFQVLQVPSNPFNCLYSQLSADLVAKFEAQLTRLMNLIKTIDYKSIIVSSVSIESEFANKILRSDSINEEIAARSSVSSSSSESPMKLTANVTPPTIGAKSVNENFGPLIDSKRFKSTLSKVHSSIVDSYSCSLHELEEVCKKKLKMLR